MIRGILFDCDTMICSRFGQNVPEDTLRVLARLHRDDFKLGLYADRPLQQLQDLPAALLACFVFLQGRDGVQIRIPADENSPVAWQPSPENAAAGGRTDVLKQFCELLDVDPAETAVFSGAAPDADILKQAGIAISSVDPARGGIRTACEHFGWIAHE
jgi:hypothetical protein